MKKTNYFFVLLIVFCAMLKYWVSLSAIPYDKLLPATTDAVRDLNGAIDSLIFLMMAGSLGMGMRVTALEEKIKKLESSKDADE